MVYWVWVIENEESIQIVDDIWWVVGSSERRNTAQETRSGESLPTQAGAGPTASSSPKRAGGNLLRSTHRMSVESGSKGVWERKYNPSEISGMAKSRILWADLGQGIGAVRWTGRNRLGMAECGRLYGQSAVGAGVCREESHRPRKKWAQNARFSPMRRDFP